MSVLKVLQALENNSSRNEKIRILQNEKNNTMVRDVIEMALNPFRTFFIRQYNMPVPAAQPTSSLQGFMQQLTRLEKREVTGHAAIALIETELSKLSADDQEVARRIILKDLRCGVQESTVNKVWKNLIPTYPCLLGHPYTEDTKKHISYPAYSQIKADGMRFNAIVENGKVTYRGRSGREIMLHGCLEDDFVSLAQGKNVVFDGELVFLSDKGVMHSRKISNGIANKAVKGTISVAEAQQACVQLWDLIDLEDFRKSHTSKPYETRFSELDKLVSEGSFSQIRLIETRKVKDLQEALVHFQEALDSGQEGIMLKNVNTLWEDTRSNGVLKFKAEKECELEIVGWNPGKPGSKRDGKIGSLIMRSSDGQVEVNVSGFDDELLDELTNNIDSYMGKIGTVIYNERISSQSKGRDSVDSLFLPRLKVIRTDKTTADSGASIK